MSKYQAVQDLSDVFEPVVGLDPSTTGNVLLKDRLKAVSLNIFHTIKASPDSSKAS
jgi:hypothetical protein